MSEIKERDQKGRIAGKELDIQEIYNRYSKGEKLVDLGLEYGISAEALRIRIKKSGGNTSNIRVLPMNEIQEEYLRGTSIKDLAELYNISVEALRIRLIKNGCKIRQNTENALLKTSNYNSNLSEYQKGYLAGLLDGEGSIVISKNGEFGLNTSIEITNTNLEALETIKQWTNCGIIRKHSSADDKRRECFRWGTRIGVEVEKILEDLSLYMIIKKERATLVKEYLMLIRAGEILPTLKDMMAEKYYNKSIELNRRGTQHELQ